MSSFSNGGYIPSGMDFADWVEYLEARSRAYEEAIFLGEIIADIFEPETDFKLSIPEGTLSKIRANADGFIKNLEKSMSGKSKVEKVEILESLQEETHNRLLFAFIKENEALEADYLFESPSMSFLEEARKAQTFNTLSTILETKSFDPENTELIQALKQYDSVLKNEPWAKNHSDYIDKWLNSKAGDKSTVFTKILDAKLKVMEESINNEPEQKKKQSHKRSFDMER